MRITLISFLFLLLLNSGMTAQTSMHLPPAFSGPDKSGKLLAYPEKLDRSFLGKAGIATLEVIGMEAFDYAIMIMAPKSLTHWPEKYWRYFGQNFKNAYTMPPVWDKDPWPVNYIGHPYQGAVFFNSLRSQNCSFLACAGFNILHTYLWEYGFEAIVERPSCQDLITTPIAGIALGELFHYLTKKMSSGGFTTGEKILVAFINPCYAINNGFRQPITH